jgi:hypothetical protein
MDDPGIPADPPLAEDYLHPEDRANEYMQESEREAENRDLLRGGQGVPPVAWRTDLLAEVSQENKRLDRDRTAQLAGLLGTLKREQLDRPAQKITQRNLFQI